MTHRNERELRGQRRSPGSRARARCDIVVCDGEVTRPSCGSSSRPGSSRRSCAGRQHTEVPDIAARICGICPVAYQMSAWQAIENGCGVDLGAAGPRPAPPAVLRRVDREPRAAHLPAARPRLPRLPGRGRAGQGPPRRRRARSAPEEGRQRHPRGLGGRAIHPVNAACRWLLPRSHRGPTCAPLAERWRRALDDALETVGLGRRVHFPARSSAGDLVALDDPDRYPIEGGQLAIDTGLDIAPDEFDRHFTEEQVRTPPRCTPR